MAAPRRATCSRQAPHPATTIASFPLPGNSFGTVAPNGTFFVRVRAVNACGVSPPSNERTVIVPSCGPAPGAPSTPAATINAGIATVTWGSVNGAARYRLDVGTTPGGSNTASQTVTGTSLPLAGLPTGNYFMRVTAIDGCGSAGPPSGEGSFMIVNAVTLQSIMVTGPSTIVAGQSGQYTATGRFSNGSSSNITVTAAWATSNSGVAAPIGPGLFSAMGVGNATISAGLQGITGSTAVQVVQPRASFSDHRPATIPPAKAGECMWTPGANQPNHLRCTFDGSASVPDNATYAWEIPLGVPNGNTETVNGTSLSFGCGTPFGPDAHKRTSSNVKLTVTDRRHDRSSQTATNQLRQVLGSADDAPPFHPGGPSVAAVTGCLLAATSGDRPVHRATALAVRFPRAGRAQPGARQRLHRRRRRCDDGVHQPGGPGTARPDGILRRGPLPADRDAVPAGRTRRRHVTNIGPGHCSGPVYGTNVDDYVRPPTSPSCCRSGG